MTIRVTRDRQDEIVEVFQKVLTCKSFDEVANGILRPFADHISAETASFRQFSVVGGALSIGHNCAHRVAATSHKQYTAYFHQMDPVLRFGMRPSGRLRSLSEFGFDVFRLAEICQYQQLTKTEYYQDFFRPNHIHHVLVMAFRLSNNCDQMVLFGFHRPSSAPDFSRQELMRARAAAPAILSTLNGMALESALQRQWDIVAGLELVAQERGIVILGRDQSVLYGNASGLSALGLERISMSIEGSVEKQLIERIGSLRASMDGAAPPDGLEGETLRLNSAVNGGYVTVRLQAFAPMRGESAILITTEADLESHRLDSRMERFGLTVREREITRLIVGGSSNKQVASDLSVSLRTIENHLRSIYSKVGVNTRSQLINQLCRDFLKSSPSNFRH